MNKEPHFNGHDYNAESDFTRLSDQHLRIKKLMLDGQWRTLSEIERQTDDPQASISAQLRHLRKNRFGSFTLEKRPRGDRRLGLYEYKLSPANTTSEFAVKDRRNKMREALLLVWNSKEVPESLKIEIKKIFKDKK